MSFFDKLKQVADTRSTHELEKDIEDLERTWQDRQAARQVLDQRKQEGKDK